MQYLKDLRELEFYETTLIELVKAQVQRAQMPPNTRDMNEFISTANTAAKNMIEKRKQYILD